MLEYELSELVQKKKDIAIKWQGLLNNLEEWEELDVALLLENQRLYNTNPNLRAEFIKLSVPVVRQVWDMLRSCRLFSIQPQFGAEGSFYHVEFADNEVWMKRTKITSERRQVKTSYLLRQLDGRFDNLAAQAEIAYVLAHELALDIDRQSFADVQDAAATRVHCDAGGLFTNTYEKLYARVAEVSKTVKEKSRRGEANWIVTSPEISSIFEMAHELEPSDYNVEISYLGMIDNRWRLYKDSLFPANKMLLGYKGNHPYDSGYFFCPQAMLELSPVVLDPDSFLPRRKIIVNGKRQVADPTCYAVIDVQII